MKKYKVLITGNLYFTTDNEDKAIKYAEEKIEQLHKSYNMSIFSIAEVREEEWNTKYMDNMGQQYLKI